MCFLHLKARESTVNKDELVSANFCIYCSLVMKTGSKLCHCQAFDVFFFFGWKVRCSWKCWRELHLVDRKKKESLKIEIGGCEFYSLRFLNLVPLYTSLLHSLGRRNVTNCQIWEKLYPQDNSNNKWWILIWRPARKTAD